MSHILVVTFAHTTHSTRAQLYSSLQERGEVPVLLSFATERVRSFAVAFPVGNFGSEVGRCSSLDQ